MANLLFRHKYFVKYLLLIIIIVHLPHFGVGENRLQNDNDEEEAEVEEATDDESEFSTTSHSSRTTEEIVININSSSANEGTAVANVYNEDIVNYVHGEEQGNATNETSTKKPRVKVTCISFRNVSDEEQSSSDLVVEIANTTTLLHDILYINSSVKSRATPSNCSVVLFFAHWCPFSANAGPHFNALPRVFPSIRISAIDSSIHTTVNTYFGILSVPTLILFHNGRIIAKFNDTNFTLNKFVDFIQTFTDLESVDKINVTSQDFHGPLSSVATKQKDFYLYLAWLFIIVCFFYYASKSVIWRKVIDLVRTTWREAEAQHEHAD